MSIIDLQLSHTSSIDKYCYWGKGNHMKHIYLKILSIATVVAFEISEQKDAK